MPRNWTHIKKHTPHIYHLTVMNAHAVRLERKKDQKSQEINGKSWILRSSINLGDSIEMQMGQQNPTTLPQKLTLWRPPRHHSKSKCMLVLSTTPQTLMGYMGGKLRGTVKETSRHQLTKSLIELTTQSIEATASKEPRAKTPPKEPRASRCNTNETLPFSGWPVLQVHTRTPKTVRISRSWGHCWYCGHLITVDFSEKRQGNWDHQLPKSKGGQEVGNLVLSCRRCNAEKANRTVEEFREAVIGKKAKFTQHLPGAFFGETLRWILEERLESGNVAFRENREMKFAAQTTLLLFATASVEHVQRWLSEARHPLSPWVERPEEGLQALWACPNPA